MNYVLTELQADFLSEMINVAYGKATARIAQILNAFATMSIPTIKYATKLEMLSEIELEQKNHKGCYLAIQNFIGKFDGETIFLIGEKSAQNLLEHLKTEYNESKEDIVIELANIVTALLITELANNLETDIYFNDPSFVHLLVNDKLDNTVKSDYNHIIAIDAIMEFKDQDIHSHIYILTHDKSFDWLLATLNRKIEEFGL